MAKLNESQANLQTQLKTQSDQFSKMQTTNAELQKNLSQITTQNMESQRKLSEANEQAMLLQRQLAEASSKKGGSSSVWIWVAIIAIILFIVSLITR
jgi:uncharacterized membrane protein (DUF106 family)